MTVFKTSLKLKSKTYSSKQLGSIKESDFFKNVFCYWILYQRTKDEKKNSHRSPLVCAHIYTIIDRKKRHSCRFTAAHVKHFWSRRDLTWRCGAFQGTGSVGDIVCLKEKYVKQWKHTVWLLFHSSLEVHPFIGLYEKSHLLQDIEEITDLLGNRSMPVWNHHLCNTESKSSSEHYKICHRPLQMLLYGIWICAIDIIYQGLVFQESHPLKWSS